MSYQSQLQQNTSKIDAAQDDATKQESLKKHVKTWQKIKRIAKSVQDKAMGAAKAVG